MVRSLDTDIKNLETGIWQALRKTDLWASSHSSTGVVYSMRKISKFSIKVNTTNSARLEFLGNFVEKIELKFKQLERDLEYSESILIRVVSRLF